MNQSSYPKLKYQGVEIKPGQHHTENPGYIYQKVNTPEEEAALEGEWHDTPRAAVDVFKNAVEQKKREMQEAQGRERGIPPAGGEGGGAPAMPEGDDKRDAADTVAKKDNGGEKPRRTEDWPTESEKKRKH